MVVIDEVEDFDIKEVLECGQCFRYKPIEDGSYEVVANGRRLGILQKGRSIELDCDQAAYDEIWANYLDLNRDYGVIKQKLCEMDERMAVFIQKSPGIRIMQQDPFEMMLTFILSQNKSMPQIMVLVERLSNHYGEVFESKEQKYYAFPKPEALGCVDEADFREMKTGFRAPYLVDAIRHVNDGIINLDALYDLPTDMARSQLMAVKGIGRKVADCILLFGYGKWDVFPLDVWMKRAVARLYFDGEKVSDRKMLDTVSERFGDLAGIAQQYIFYGMVKEN